MHLNLLPADFRLKLLVRRRLRKWAVVWAACTLLLVVPVAFKYRQLASSQTRVLLIEGRCKPTRNAEKETRALEAQLASLGKQHPFAEGMELADVTLGLLGELGHRVAQSDGKLQILRMDLRTMWEAPRPVSSAKTAVPGTNSLLTSSSVMLQGEALDDASVARFMSGLRDNDLLGSLKLKSYSARPTPEGVVREYQIEGSL